LKHSADWNVVSPAIDSEKQFLVFHWNAGSSTQTETNSLTNSNHPEATLKVMEHQDPEI